MDFFKGPNILIPLILFTAIMIVPLVFPSNYYFRVGALIFINALAVTGMVILMGFAGQVSLGHGGFVGIGAYSSALAPIYLGLHPVAATLFGVVISVALSIVIGRSILKLKGYYLAVATLGFGLIVFLALVSESQITGGPDGIAVEALGIVEVIKSIGIKAKTSVIWYVFTGFILCLGVMLALNIRFSRTGMAMRSLHLSEIAASSIGIDTARIKLIAFAISAAYASLSGSLLAQFNQFITPDVASFLHSIEIVTMAVLGGISSLIGGLLGTLFLTALPQALTIFHEYEHVMLGLVMMTTMIILPQGIIPSISKRMGLNYI